MPIEIREALEEEHEEVGRVTAGAYAEFARPGDGDWEEYLERIADVPGRADRTTILVAVEGTVIVGSATLELLARVEEPEDPPLRPHEAHIRMLGVDPAWRGRGVGGLLMETCERLALERGKTLMTLHTTQRMAAARRMYERLGYERGEDRVFPDGFVLLSYTKRLD
ncbi:MAG TPA: GNAT family N-acetyltransferase [Actinomycetota bacterium]|jgi:ribosomal protein S18 acetylase RimI-like enzyme